MILVTGATGNIGREVVKALQQKRVPVRAAAISEADAARLPTGVASAMFDFANPDTYAAALSEVDKVFLMRPPHLGNMDTTLNPFVDYAKAMGVRHIVFVSLLGVENNPRVPHYAAEQHIKQCGIAYTFLRPSFFMQNLNTTHRDEIRLRREIYVPVGDARTSFIDTRDIGAVAAHVLTSAGHEGCAYALTGSHALDYYQVADILSEELGQPIVYRNPATAAFLWYTLRRGIPMKFALVMAMLYRATRNGSADVVTDDVGKLLGRPPISFRQYARDYAQAWSNPIPA